MRWTSTERVAFVALLLGASGIGFAPILVRWSEIGPVSTGGFRILLSLPILAVWLFSEGRGGRGDELDRPSNSIPQGGREWALLAGAGFCFAGDLACWHWSIKLTSVANSSLLLNLAPIIVILGARLFLHERISGWLITGLACALAGGTLLVWTSLDRTSSTVLGDVLAVITAFFYAGYLLLVKLLRRSLSSGAIIWWSGLISGPALLGIGWVSMEQIRPPTTRAWLVLAGLALISHIGGQGAIGYGMAHLKASFSAVSLLLQPVVAAVLAWLLLHETLTAGQLAGGVVVLMGILIASRDRA